jgi:hypothetical protein
MTLVEIDTYLESKISKNPEYIVFTFYELRIKLNFSSEETLNFLHLVRTKLENNNYKIYTSGQAYTYKDKKNRVNDNELLIAVKEQNKNARK